MAGSPVELESTPCLLCGSLEHSSICEQGQFGLPAHVVVCQNCGFSFLNPRWTKDRYDRFYAEEYDRYYRPEVLAQNAEGNRYAPIKAIIARMTGQEYWRPFRNVLDLGSGMGHALIHLKSILPERTNYEAIEPSQACREHLLANNIGYVSPDVYAPWEMGKTGRYDLVIMRHVLEHFHDPLLVLRKVREVLADDGLLYIAVPDAAHPTKPLRSHFFRVVHISYFTGRSLSTILRMAGLEPVKVSEGDSFDRHEVYAICRKGVVAPFHPESKEYDRQMDIYRMSGKWDQYHELKSGLISTLRRLHLLR